LEKFGLKSLKDLPPLEDFAPDEESRSYIRARLSAGVNGFAPAQDEGDEREASIDDEDLELVD
jgi:segregation and condensation protein B